VDDEEIEELLADSSGREASGEDPIDCSQGNTDPPIVSAAHQMLRDCIRGIHIIQTTQGKLGRIIDFLARALHLC